MRQSQPAARVTPRQQRPALARPRDCVLGGVCAGMASHLGWSVTGMRWLTVCLALCGGAGVLLYVWLWALVPVQQTDAGAQSPVRRRVPVAWLLVACAIASAIAVLAFQGGDQSVLGAQIGSTVALIVCAAGAVAWEQFIEVRGAARPLAASVVRITAGTLLLVVALLSTLPITGAATGTKSPVGFILSVAMLLAGLAALLGPWAVRLWRELIAERTKRVREEQRSEIAAHLHDSVLQTLALIQNRAGASSEVARIARAQERELREWLYAGVGTADSDLGTDLRDFGASLELDYAVRIEVITAGTVGERSSSEIAAAAREAMLNAARHAGGDVSVYVESSEAALDVFVRDRGPGFEVSGVSDDRLGVRESIVGRMRRAGGWASVGAGAAGIGTEVHLHQNEGDA